MSWPRLMCLNLGFIKLLKLNHGSNELIDLSIQVSFIRSFLPRSNLWNSRVESVTHEATYNGKLGVTPFLSRFIILDSSEMIWTGPFLKSSYTIS